MLPGHAKCTPQKKLNEPCVAEFSLLGFQTGIIGANECAPGVLLWLKFAQFFSVSLQGLKCISGKCQTGDALRAKEGEKCTGRSIMHHLEHLCEDSFYCHPSTQKCVRWPQKLWASCSNSSDCGPGLECNCKVGGVKVCEVKKRRERKNKFRVFCSSF
jgi:hypothetical protein